MKRITRKYREAIRWAGLNDQKWLVKQVNGDQILIKHKESGNEREIPL